MKVDELLQRFLLQIALRPPELEEVHVCAGSGLPNDGERVEQIVVAVERTRMVRTHVVAFLRAVADVLAPWPARALIETFGG